MGKETLRAYGTAGLRGERGRTEGSGQLRGLTRGRGCRLVCSALPGFCVSALLFKGLAQAVRVQEADAALPDLFHQAVPFQLA